MTTSEIKKKVKEITGYEYIAIRKGSGSESGYINIFSSFNDRKSLKPFEKEIRAIFPVEIFSDYTVTIKNI